MSAGMAKFTIRACWDEEAGVWYSESDISGFSIEAETLEEFEKLMDEHAPVLVYENHIKPAQSVDSTFRELLPTLIWQRPTDKVNCA